MITIQHIIFETPALRGHLHVDKSLLQRYALSQP